MAHIAPTAPKSSPWWKRRSIEIAGWALVILGVIALVLPGPGLLGVVAGLALLSTQYAWAKRLLRPVKVKALQLAIKSVQTWPRITGSAIGGLALIAVGVVWGIQPDVPSWWPLSERWWLVGGWATASTLIVSGVGALALLVYSFRRFRDPSRQDLRAADQDQKNSSSKPLTG